MEYRSKILPLENILSMFRLSRRKFVKTGAAATMIKLTGGITSIFNSDSIGKKVSERMIHLTSDGLNLSPLDYSRLLLKLAEEGRIRADDYSLGGSIEELELEFAKLLGKEAAFFVPTGTLANHLAIRALSKGRNRVIVQNDSHIYCDSGDCVQTLSNLNLIPVAKATLKEIEEVIDRTATGRVATKVGVILIETPIRRRSGEMSGLDEMKKISAFAKKNGINLHLDGARIFLASAYTGIAPSEYAALFDTVYVSLYKYFNAASGAILAGPKAVIENMYHARRMFGSGLPEAWPYAAIALHYLDGFMTRFKEAIKVSEELIAILGKHPGFRIERVASGTNIFRLKVVNIDGNSFRENLKSRGLLIRSPEKNGNDFSLFVNESLNLITAPEFAELFIQSLSGKR
jgi:threonine aldolase